MNTLLGGLAAALFLPIVAVSQHANPAREEVPLAGKNGWKANLVLDAGVGVWTVKSFQVQPRFGAPEIVGLDDEGKCTILRSYSGKWTPMQTVGDGRWLAPVAHADIDRDLPGKELYAAGQAGRVYQIWPRPTGGFDTRVVAEWPGDEVHTLVAGELDVKHPGHELYAFTLSGKFWRVGTKRGQAPALIRDVGGRVRDAVVLPALEGESPWIATVSRAREVALYRTTAMHFEKRTILEEDMGFGRICSGSSPEGRQVLYVTRDDGLVLRLEEHAPAKWRREMIYAGPQGLRGLVTGRFHEDPKRECIAVFGYSKKVQLLTRLPGEPWEVTTIFEDIDKGHWLEVAELDGRNSTDEIICSGYSGRICLVYRPEGYGLPGVPTDPDSEEANETGGAERQASDVETGKD